MNIWLIVSLVAVAVVISGCFAIRGGYESAPYRVLRTDGHFEVRYYPSLTIVETPMAGTDSSFRRLFNYITGSNAGRQKIAMTTPVFMSGAETNRTMAFVMPAKMTASQAPAPADANLRVRELPAGCFAVLRFSGGRYADREARELAALKEWMTAQKLTVQSEPIFGYFDPPWTPPFMRRNEVMLRTTVP